MSKTKCCLASVAAPWHAESYHRLLHETLPTIIAQRLPLNRYDVTVIDLYTSKLTIAIGGIEVVYRLPQCDDEGLFCIADRLHVVVPVAQDANLETTVVKCVGEQIADFMTAHIGESSGELPWDDRLVKAWLPLDTWISGLITGSEIKELEGWTIGEPLATNNSIARYAHLRRIKTPKIQAIVHLSQNGRVCPYETPENTSLGPIWHIAAGCRILDGQLVIIDDNPSAVLGWTTRMVPFLEHNDPVRQLFGVNMMYQWIPLQQSEAPLVQTGIEPDIPQIWCGRNLLTAYISMGADTYEDAVLVSESAARKLGAPEAAQVGDRLSNRHGTKGVISRVVPDTLMPRLPDGTPMELVFSFLAFHTRLNFGQVREAVMGRIAMAEGQPAIVPPFKAPSDTELRERLRSAALPEDGMEQLLDPSGKPYPLRSTVGMVYWGMTCSRAKDRLRVCHEGENCQRQGAMENQALRDMDCHYLVLEGLNTRSRLRQDWDALENRLVHGQIAQQAAPTPLYQHLVQRLNAVGICLKADGERITFSYATPTGDVLQLTEVLPHPWHDKVSLSSVGKYPDLPEFRRLEHLNDRLFRLAGAPEAIYAAVRAELQQALTALCEILITPESLQLGSSVLFSGRAVLAPSTDLHSDQVGLGEEIAWGLFSPMVIRELGDANAVEQRTEEAASKLDEVMAHSWVMVNRAPTLTPTALMAFRPVRISDPVIRLHPLACFLMNADYDGDMVAVHLPVTPEGQREAEHSLSLRGHLKRDPMLYGLRLLNNDMVWGLAWLSQTPIGRQQIQSVVDGDWPDSKLLTRGDISQVLQQVMKHQGIDAVVEATEQLMQLGYDTISATGASISPFVGVSLELPDGPYDDNQELWPVYAQDVSDILSGSSSYDDNHLGPQLLAVKSEARGSMSQLARLVSAIGMVHGIDGQMASIHHSLREGLSHKEAFEYSSGTLRGLAAATLNSIRDAYGVSSNDSPRGYGVLVRAMRATQPGRVFARAAMCEEVDPLHDVDARLFYGLPG